VLQHQAVQRRSFAPLLLLAGWSCVATAACARRPQEGTRSAGRRLRLAMIPKGTTHEFWKSVHAGGVKAARELDVDLVWKGPLKEDDLKGQVDLVQSFAAQHVSGILLAPLNDRALVASVDGAARAGVPVVILDSALRGGNIVSFVATDNRAAGRLAGRRMAELLGGPGTGTGKSRVVVLRYQEGSASTHAREEGFLDVVRTEPGLEVVSDNQYGGATTESAFAAAESLLLAKKMASPGPGVGGVFTPNESTTFGMLLALEKAGLAGKIRFVGFDASDKLVRALRAGEIDALVVQNPFNMGYLAVKALVARLRGGQVEARTDTGARLVDKANLDSAETSALVRPDLERWLGP
jgi:ribose transport system substrate-binding protein